MLKERGLSQTGVKSVLVARLQDQESGQTTVDVVQKTPVKRSGLLKNRLMSRKQDTGSTSLATSSASSAAIPSAPKMAPFQDEGRGDAIDTMEKIEYELDDLELLMGAGEAFLKKKQVAFNGNDDLDMREVNPIHAARLNGSKVKDEVYSKIVALIEKRAFFKAEKDYPAADAVRQELMNDYNVEIYDKTGEWRDEDGRYGKFVSTIKAAKVSTGDCPLSKEEIQARVRERTLARRARKYALADEIRDELASFGVELFDKLNEWETSDGKMKGMQSYDRES